MQTPSKKAYPFVSSLEPMGHDVWSCRAEGGQSKWGVRQDPREKARVRRALKRSNRAAMDKFEREAA